MTAVIHYRLHKLRKKKKKLNERYIVRFFQFATTKNGNVATPFISPRVPLLRHASYRTNFPTSIAPRTDSAIIIPERIFSLRCL